MFEHFVEHGNYSKTAEYISRQYGNEEFSISRFQVTKIVRNTVYIGKPSKTIDTERIEDNKATVSDPALEIIDKDTFNEAVEIVEENIRKYSTSGEVLDPLDFIGIAGIETALCIFANLELHCVQCGGTQLEKNGQRQTDDVSVHNYKCRDCDRQQKWPNKKLLEELRETIDF